MPAGLSDPQLLLIVCGTVLVVLILTGIGYWACYRQKENHEPRSRNGGEEDPLLSGGAAGRQRGKGSGSPGKRPSSPVPAATKSWTNSYGELGKSQVVTINRWIDELVKANSEQNGGYQDIEDKDYFAMVREGSSNSGTGSPYSSSTNLVLSPTSDSHYIPMGGENSAQRSTIAGSPRVSVGGVSNYSGDSMNNNNNNQGGNRSSASPPPLARDATMEGPRDPLEE